MLSTNAIADRVGRLADTIAENLLETVLAIPRAHVPASRVNQDNRVAGMKWLSQNIAIARGVVRVGAFLSRKGCLYLCVANKHPVPGKKGAATQMMVTYQLSNSRFSLVFKTCPAVLL